MILGCENSLLSWTSVQFGAAAFDSLEPTLREALTSSLQSLRTGLQDDINDLTRRIRDDLNDIVDAVPPPPTDNILTDELLEDVAARMERIRAKASTVASHPFSQANSYVVQDTDRTESIRDSSSVTTNSNHLTTTPFHNHEATFTVSSPFTAPIPSTGVHFHAFSPIDSVASYNQGPVSASSLAQPPPSQFHLENHLQPNIQQANENGVSFMANPFSPLNPTNAQPNANVPFQIILPSNR